MNVLMMRTLVSTALILLSACESRDDTANSESEVSPPDQALESDSSLNDPLDPVADDMGLDDQEVSRDLEVDDLDLGGDMGQRDVGSMTVDMSESELDLGPDIDRGSEPSLDMLIRFEDDPVFTVEIPEELTPLSGQSNVYRLPVVLTRLAESIQGWSFTLVAHPQERCRLVAVDTTETWAASVNDSPPGLVGQGLNDSRIVQTDEGPIALSAVIFSFQERVLLSPSQIARPLIQIDLEVTPPEVGQRAGCSISAAPEALVEGQTVDQVVVWEGQSLPLLFVPVTVDLPSEE